MARILIVEASRTQAERLRLILKTAGLQAAQACDAEGAMALLREGGFDLVITDIVIPGRSGYELCRDIKAHSEWRSLPVVLLTNLRDPMDIFRGLECGADNFYTKPYEPERLVERLRNILYNRQLRAEGKLQLGVQVSMFGRTFNIGYGREQILDLLVSTFEDIVQTNVELERTRDELARANARLDQHVAQLEGRVEDSEGLHRAIVEGMGEGVLLIGPGGRVLSANPTASDMLGRNGDALLGCRLEELVRLPGGASVDGTSLGALSRSPRECIGRHADGRDIPMSAVTSSVPMAGTLVSVWVLRDLSEQRAVELQLRQAQKMEAVGQLTGGIAHDFNNLLTVMLGNAEALQGMLPERADAVELADMIAEAALRGSELTSRLLAFARRQPLAPRPINVARLVRDMQPLLARSLGEQIEIEVQCIGAPWPALVDASQLESALLNLCLNARDAMPAGGRLDLMLDSLSVGPGSMQGAIGLAAGDYVRLRVADRGCGISAETMERILEPFFTTKPVGKGTGMGLPMVYGFSKQSGGHLQIESEPGHGTVVSLLLPRAEQDEAPRDADVPGLEGGHERVLLVEDDPLVRDYAAEQLRSLGYEVHAAASGPEALQLLQARNDFDLLFTDVVMPGGMSGQQLVEAARQLHSGLKVLYTSGYAEEVIVHDGRLDAGVRLLGKPYRRAQLASQLRAALVQP